MYDLMHAKIVHIQDDVLCTFQTATWCMRVWRMRGQLYLCGCARASTHVIRMQLPVQL
jgi:hypothetical protein